jgi:translation elongation factor EF-1alpha
MNTLIKSAFYGALVIGMGVVFSSTGCRKKKDTTALIYVLDAQNQRVADAEVVLKGESTVQNSPPVVLFDTTTSDGAGVASFNFNDVYQLGQAGVAVLNIEARKDALSGEAIIKIEQEKQNEESVFIQ